MSTPDQNTAENGNTEAPALAAGPGPTGPHDRDVKAELPQNILAGLTVSFAAISLGAAFGLQSGRDNGIVIGIMSAGLIAFVTSLLGGTRIQCSGPTAPMTTVTMAIWAAASTVLATQLTEAGYTKDHFMTMVLLMTAGILLIMAVFRLGKYITLVPAEAMRSGLQARGVVKG